MVRAEVLVVTVLVSPVRVVRVELGVQVGLEDVAEVGGTQTTQRKSRQKWLLGQEVEVVLEGVDY